MARSSSILTALPNMKIYCMRFENSHIFRSLSRALDSGAGSDASISSRPLFRGPIITDPGMTVRVIETIEAGAANGYLSLLGEVS